MSELVNILNQTLAKPLEYDTEGDLVENENTNIRLSFDNQVIEALKHFNEADAFIQSSN